MKGLCIAWLLKDFENVYNDQQGTGNQLIYPNIL